MLVRIIYMIRFHLPAQVAIVAHAERRSLPAKPICLNQMSSRPESALNINTFIDSPRQSMHALCCARRSAAAYQFHARPLPRYARRRQASDARENLCRRSAPEVLIYLLNSRYCEADRISSFAASEFGHLRFGWSQAFKLHLRLGQRQGRLQLPARASHFKSALDVYIRARWRLPRLSASSPSPSCRALNIPAQ